jgi:hypothetical protein
MRGLVYSVFLFFSGVALADLSPTLLGKNLELAKIHFRVFVEKAGENDRGEEVEYAINFELNGNLLHRGRTDIKKGESGPLLDLVAFASEKYFSEITISGKVIEIDPLIEINPWVDPGWTINNNDHLLDYRYSLGGGLSKRFTTLTPYGDKIDVTLDKEFATVSVLEFVENYTAILDKVRTYKYCSGARVVKEVIDSIEENQLTLAEKKELYLAIVGNDRRAMFNGACRIQSIFLNF